MVEGYLGRERASDETQSESSRQNAEPHLTIDIIIYLHRIKQSD